MTTPPDSHDLRSLLRSVGGLAGGGSGALLSAPSERPDVSSDIEIIDTDPSEVVASPLDTLAFVDGIQNARVLSWRDHRPVYLTYVAAAAVGSRLTVHALDERIALVCSTEDEDWVRSLGGSLPVRLLAATGPSEVENAAFAFLGAAREEAERAITDELMAQPGTGALVLDGTLVGRPSDPRCVGVVKSTDRRYLTDEQVLWDLPVGWRSPRFIIPPGHGSGVTRYSCYLRLFPHANRPWNFALLRLEAFNPELLDLVAARCLAERQGPGAPDSRWERHLGGVRMVEEYLRSRRPAVFD